MVLPVPGIGGHLVEQRLRVERIAAGVRLEPLNRTRVESEASSLRKLAQLLARQRVQEQPLALPARCETHQALRQVGSSSRAAITTSTGSTTSRRTTKSSARSDATSAQCASSTKRTTGAPILQPSKHLEDSCASDDTGVQRRGAAASRRDPA